MKAQETQIEREGRERAEAFMAQFSGYAETPAGRRSRKALDKRQTKSLAKDFSGERRGGIEELREIPGFAENETAIRKDNALRLAIAEARRRSGLTQTALARRMGMPQPNVSRLERGGAISFSTFSDYLAACGFDFSITLLPIASRDASEVSPRQSHSRRAHAFA